MEASTIVSIILAIVSLLGTIVVAICNYKTTSDLANEARKSEERLLKQSGRQNRDLQKQATELSNKYDKLKEERQEKKETDALVIKYGQPLMVATYELQARLYELCQYPISIAHIESMEGLQDLKQYTCFKFAQFLAWTHILKVKTQFFSFKPQGDRPLDTTRRRRI
jgi:uncharacterized protein YoxC